MCSIREHTTLKNAHAYTKLFLYTAADLYALRFIPVLCCFILKQSSVQQTKPVHCLTAQLCCLKGLETSKIKHRSCALKFHPFNSNNSVCARHSEDCAPCSKEVLVQSRDGFGCLVLLRAP